MEGDEVTLTDLWPKFKFILESKKTLVPTSVYRRIIIFQHEIWHLTLPRTRNNQVIKNVKGEQKNKLQ